MVDRLNPSRNMIPSIESQYGESAENTQKVMVNMMTDLRCELVVTLGDARLSEEQENKLLEEHRQWEEFKVELLSLEYFFHLKISEEIRVETSSQSQRKEGETSC